MNTKHGKLVSAVLMIAGLTLSFGSPPETCPSAPKNSYLSTWQSLYPTSQSDDNVILGTGRSCLLCHGENNGGDNYNSYGWAMYLLRLQGQSVQNATQMIEGADSDLDPTGSTNLVEIQTDTQPGWTVGPNNTIYYSDGTTLPNQPPPATIFGNFDPTAGDPEIGVSPLSLDFGTVVVGQTQTLTTTISNTGPIDLTVTGLTIQGSSDFAVNTATPSRPFIVRSNNSTDVLVDFAPTSVTALSGTLTIASNDPGEPTIVVSLIGTGVSAPEPEIEISPLTLAFGSVGVGSSKILSATIRNLGSGDLTVTILRIAGGSSPAYRLDASAPIPPVVIPPSGSVDVAVAFTPASTGWNAGTLDVWSDDVDEYYTGVGLTGTGVIGAPEIQVFPTTLDYGAVGAGTQITLATTITNVGTADLTVTGLTVQGDPEFALGAAAPQAPFALPPDGSIDVPVDFTATAGIHTGTLVIESDDVAQPTMNVGLTGTGTLGSVDLDVRSFDVSRRFRGRPIEIELVVENNGTVNEPRPATVVGQQNGTIVYQEVVMVQDSVGNGSTRFDFPQFTPTVLIEILWEVVIADDDPDDDRATATTTMAVK